jgi:hypothetical protein
MFSRAIQLEQAESSIRWERSKNGKAGKIGDEIGNRGKPKIEIGKSKSGTLQVSQEKTCNVPDFCR